MSEIINLDTERKKRRPSPSVIKRVGAKVTKFVDKAASYYDSKTGIEANTPDPSIANRKDQGSLNPEDTGEFDIADQWNVRVDHEGKLHEQ